MAYITKRGSSYGVRYTYQDEQGKNCNKWAPCTGTFRINKCMQRVQKASLAKTGKDCILQEFEDKREGSTTTLVLKKTIAVCVFNAQATTVSSISQRGCFDRHYF